MDGVTSQSKGATTLEDLTVSMNTIGVEAINIVDEHLLEWESQVRTHDK